LLELVTDLFFRQHLIPLVQQGTPEFQPLPKLTQETYVDYFVRMVDIERSVSRLPSAGAVAHAAAILTAYSTESSYPLLSGIAQFFQKCGKPEGYESLLREACRVAKAKQDA
jgi:hypothetical protein